MVLNNASPERAVAGSQVDVVVVDDDPMISAIIETLLTRSGIRCATFVNGREALRHLERHPARVVVTDILMPEVDGYELIPRLRKTSPGIRIIAITGNAPSFGYDMHRTARLLGADLVVGKPFEIEDLLRAVQDQLAYPAAGAATDVHPATGT